MKTRIYAAPAVKGLRSNNLPFTYLIYINVWGKCRCEDFLLVLTISWMVSASVRASWPLRILSHYCDINYFGALLYWTPGLEDISQQTRYIQSMSFWWCATVCDDVPTSKRHGIYVIWSPKAKDLKMSWHYVMRVFALEVWTYFNFLFLSVLVGEWLSEDHHPVAEIQSGDMAAQTYHLTLYDVPKTRDSGCFVGSDLSSPGPLQGLAEETEGEEEDEVDQVKQILSLYSQSVHDDSVTVQTECTRWTVTVQ